MTHYQRSTNGCSESAHVGTNRLQPVDEPIHGWYRFVLGYPPHLVRECLTACHADPDRDWVLDPFCGTGTTPVEARLHGFATLSTDAHPLSILVTRVKLLWDIHRDGVLSALDDVLDKATAWRRQGPLNHRGSLYSPHPPNRDDHDIGLPGDTGDSDMVLSREADDLIPRGFISPTPLMDVLALRWAIQNVVSCDDIRAFMAVALAHVIVTTAGNVGFGPEVYRRPPRDDADVFGAFAATITRMVSDLQTTLATHAQPFPPALVYNDDARTLAALTGGPPIGIVITSPPYPNEKDYTRITRLESVLLGLITTKADLRAIKSGLLRSNTRNVFVGDTDDVFIMDIPSVVRLAETVEQRRVQLGKTSGFERRYHRVVSLYFGGMYRHLAALFPQLRPGARCAYVVGDQMSYFRVHIPTAHVLADVAIKAGYKVEGIKQWRARRSTTTGEEIAENILILRRP